MQKLDQYGLRPDITVGVRVEGVFQEKKISLDIQSSVIENGWRLITLNKMEVCMIFKC